MQTGGGKPRLWCDGFIAESYFLKEHPARITGTAWIGSAPDAERWRFTLFLITPARHPGDIPWHALVPALETRGWLSVFPERKEVKIRLNRIAPGR